jgi:hypothetical protein
MQKAEDEGCLAQWMREMCLNDIFFLGVYVLGRTDLDHIKRPDGTVKYRDWLYERCQEVQAAPDGFIDIWSRDHYKQNLLTEDIFTPTGWRKFGDLEIGDYVFAPNGKAIKVLARTPIETDPEQYNLTFKTFQDSQECSIQAGSEHLWDVTYTKREVSKDIYEEKLLNSKEIYEYTKSEKSKKRHRWLKIPFHKALEYEVKKLKIDPYTLGVWLGDGVCRTSCVVNGNEEIISKFKKGKVSRQGNTKKFTILGLITKLKAVGLGAIASDEKFIPEEYFTASIEQRLALIRGLMDTDGCVTKKGSLRYGTVSKTLADGLVRILQTFDVVVATSEGKTPKGSKFYNLTFSQNEYCFFSTRHHKSKLVERTLDYNYWYIKDVQRVKSKPSRCIQVEGGRYLIGKKLISTHNSTIFTFLKTIQDVLRDPEITCCIYSYSSSAATNFLKQIKGVLESNKKLIKLFPGILFEDVTKPHWIDEKGQQRRMIWSERGIRVKRKSNAKENTVEASGLVIGQRTGGHFNLLIYDDVVTPDSVTSPEMIKKTTEQWRMSLNTGSSGNLRIRILGTRYHYADTYQTIIDSGYAPLRLYPCVYKNGAPVLYDRDVIEAKKKAMGSAVFASQMMCDPKQASTMGFKREWIRTWSADNITNLNIYIIVDPAGTMKKRSDYSAFWVIGCGADKNYYIIDLIRDKFDLTGKTNTLFELMRRYTAGSRKPQVFYE